MGGPKLTVPAPSGRVRGHTGWFKAIKPAPLWMGPANTPHPLEGVSKHIPPPVGGSEPTLLLLERGRSKDTHSDPPVGRSKDRLHPSVGGFKDTLRPLEGVSEHILPPWAVPNPQSPPSRGQVQSHTLRSPSQTPHTRGIRSPWNCRYSRLRAAQCG